MSTRGFYTFKDRNGTFNVYRHSDNYPTGAAEALRNALWFAFPLPRFEADEFAAAFVAANKSYHLDKIIEATKASVKPGRGSIESWNEKTTIEIRQFYADDMKYLRGGEVRLMGSGPWKRHCPGDVEYRYEITHSGANPDATVKCFSIAFEFGDLQQELLFEGSLTDFEAWAKAEEARAQQDDAA
jgi:hypothetical protein